MGDALGVRTNSNTSKRGRHFEAAIVLAGLLSGVGTGWLAWHSGSSQHAQQVKLVEVTSRAAPGAQPPNLKGIANAPVVLEEFGDFQCWPCKELYPTVKKVEADYGTRLGVVFRHFPITSLHKNALEAARASEAAAMQGHFWEMHDRLFEDQPSWSASGDPRSIFVGYARNLRLNVTRFVHDMDGTKVNARILADQERAKSLGVPGTPVVLINGHQVPFEAVTSGGLRAAIDAELERK